ncbi:glycosyltransferase family 2 protein [Myxococcota bacterium]|nr:glycosyltransferase family 2 protein [Myxococcota bacterium]
MRSSTAPVSTEPKGAVPAGPMEEREVAAPRISVVFPCLNEEAAIGDCVEAASRALGESGFAGEVLVVDNGSTDRSAEIAAAAGARVIPELRRGYGSAYLRGFAEARGECIVLLDADGTYPAELIGEFARAVLSGEADMVIGNRFAGLMEAEAMPFLNRYLGNPVLSGMTRVLFRVGLADIHCGMRAIRRSRVPELLLQTPGMEFATEMIVKALDSGLAVKEVGIPYRPRIGESKLMPMRDAWRHVEYMLVFAPSVSFLWPGALLFAGGLALQALLLAGPRFLLFRPFDVHAHLAGVAATLLGATLLGLGNVGAVYAWSIGLRFRHGPLARWVARSGDRPSRLGGIALTGAGALMWAAVVVSWAASGFGELAAVPYLALATSLLAAGVGLLGTAFIVHVIRLGR